MNKETQDKILELIQSYILDKGIVMEGRIEKAICLMLEDALKGYTVLGNPKDIKEFKKGLPRFASHHNVTIVEK